MLCCKRENSQLQMSEQTLTRHPRENSFFQPCQVHNHSIQFICLNPECRDTKNILLCNFCLNKHKDHNWITKEDFLTKNITNILEHGTAESDQKLKGVLDTITNQLKILQQDVKDEMTKIKHQLQQSISCMQQKYTIESLENLKSQKSIIKNVVVNNRVIQKLIKIYQLEQKNYEWINVMEKFTTKMINQIQNSFTCLLADLTNVLDAQKWQDRQTFMDQFNQFHSHLHNHGRHDTQHYTFSNQDKHANISLDKTLTEAIYMRQVPSKPVVLANQYISEMKNKFGFQILKMEGLAIFFASTTVFVGVCNSSIVKAAGLRKINELGKGSYLISSEGWSYHSEDQNYNNKQIGWGFGQDDKINIQIVFDTNCKIIFTKKNRFFSNRYEMPLGLNQFQAKRLRPCVSFDSEEGAIVKIYDNKDPELF